MEFSSDYVYVGEFWVCGFLLVYLSKAFAKVRRCGYDTFLYSFTLFGFSG
jgi:hypothetical protein